MKKVLSLLGLMIALHADVPQQLYQFYQSGAYTQGCSYGKSNFKYIQGNESHLLLYAFTCLKADQIDRLNTPLMILNHSNDARANASYFSLLVLQKKLLLQALYDNYPLKSLKLPTSSHLLSKVFDLYCKNPQQENAIKEYTDPSNSRLIYKLYTIEAEGRKTIAVDEYYDKILSAHHVY